MKNQGGLSNRYAQKVAGFQKDGHGRVGVYVEREATFTERMDAIESRHFHAIVVIDMDGYSQEQEVFRMSRAEVMQLRNALDSALKACEGEYGRYIGDDDE